MPVLLPIGHLDAGPVEGPSRAPVTALVAVVCVVVFVVFQDGGQSGAWVRTFGAVPADLFGGGAGWRVATVATSIVSHASWSHLLYNLVALWVFGAAVERSVGSARFAALFAVGGMVATLAQAALWPASEVAIVGASGAVAAAAGAFAVAYPRARIVVVAVFLTFPVRVWIALGVWALVEAGSGVLGPLSEGGGVGGVAHAAHLAGFGVGITAMAAATLLRNGHREGWAFLRRS